MDAVEDLARKRITREQKDIDLPSEWVKAVRSIILNRFKVLSMLHQFSNTV